MGKMRQPGCCDCGADNCIPKFVIASLPRAGFPPLRLNGPASSYRMFGTKTITYSTEHGLAYSVTITVDHLSGQCDWSESSNLDSTQRATMFTRITNRLNAVSFSGELLNASGTYTFDVEDYDWSIAVSDEFDIADDLTALEALKDAALALLSTLDDNTRTEYGPESHVYDGVNSYLGGVTDVANLSPYTGAISSSNVIIFQYTAATYYGAFGTWWQSDLTGPPPNEEFDPGEYTCTYTNRGLGVSMAGDATLSFLHRHIVQISGDMCAKWWEYKSAAGYQGNRCTATDDGIIVSPQIEVNAIDDVRHFLGVELTSPGYLTGGTCPCSTAP